MEWDFSIGLSDTVIDNMDKVDFDSLINPDVVGIHKTCRVIIFDKIENLLVIFASEILPMRSITLKHGDRLGKRYSFHGGDNGRFDGFFNRGDKWVFIKESDNKSVEINSIPAWNLAHFFCDYLNTIEKTQLFEDWVFENSSRIDSLKGLLKGCG